MGRDNNRIEPIKRVRLSDEVLKRLQSMIINGTFDVGDSLPSEKELSEQFQVSRASVKEALRILEAIGYLSSRPGAGGGFVVRQISIEDIINPISNILENEDDMVIEMLEFRKLLETEIARLAAENRTDSDLKAIKTSIENMKRDINTGGTGLCGDRDFHDALAMASGNSIFEKMLTMAKGLLYKTIETTLNIEGQPEKSLRDHIEIYNAVELGDGELAETLMLNHILKAFRNALGKSELNKNENN